MWQTDTYWFDVALIGLLFAVGNVCFGHFEAHRPPWRRVAKLVVALALLVGVSATAGRAWTFTLLAALLVMVAVVHAWWLPKHGVNGWTAEPRERYYELLGPGPQGRPRARRPADGAEPRISSHARRDVR